MKTNYKLLSTIAVSLVFSVASWSQATLVQWNFNGASATEVAGGTTSPTPSVGAGSAELVGGVTATFSSGNSTAGTTETETTSPPNYGWNTTGYAPAGTENKMRGVQYNVSTVNQAGIILKFEQRLSNTASNTYVVQYTSDRTAGSPVWVDTEIFTVVPMPTGTGDTWFNARTADVSAVTSLDNNPNVAFRVVSAFDPGLGDYLAARSTSTYGTAGTVRFDMVTVTSNTTLATASFNTSDNNFTMVPNPSNNDTVTFNQQYDITVYDAVGKLVLQKQNTKSIDTNGFNSGVYFVKTSTGLVKKLLVK